VFPSHAQLAAVAGIRHGLAVWLIRGCGLRIEEALAVQKSCFRDGGTVLRVFEQTSKDGRKTMPLKHRKAGEFRDIPVPSYLRDMVEDLPSGVAGSPQHFPASKSARAACRAVFPYSSYVVRISFRLPSCADLCWNRPAPGCGWVRGARRGPGLMRGYTRMSGAGRRPEQGTGRHAYITLALPRPWCPWHAQAHTRLL